MPSPTLVEGDGMQAGPPLTRPNLELSIEATPSDSILPYFWQVGAAGGAKVANAGPRRPGMYSKLGATREGIQKL